MFHNRCKALPADGVQSRRPQPGRPHAQHLLSHGPCDGSWRLAPAFDVIWSYNPQGQCTNRHQMSINGKLEGFRKEDLIDVARRFHIKKPADILAETDSAVRRRPAFAEKAGVEPKRAETIAATQRLHLVSG